MKQICWGLLILGGLEVRAAEDFPIVPDEFEVSMFAAEPLVRNPCAMTFDAKGRLCVGMGPQYRSPKPDTPGDGVWIMLDDNQDGMAEGRRLFAHGFNAIQGMAWYGDWLYIANAPDLTRVRDVDGDDVADVFERLYTDLGNLEHGLHGLNFGPDGKLYMSKGNSKGLTEPPHRLAPKPFRTLWGVEVPAGIPEPVPERFTAKNYRKNFHDPRDDWGVSGGMLRADPDGSNLEIVSRGFRNPWDICFDHHFDWLGTDNDQTLGDKIFAPFYGADFGWGHAWSYDWKGDAHLPTAPSSGPLFEGSGTGVIFCGLDDYPAKCRNVFLINDWLQRKVFVYRPRWDGAWMQSDREVLEVLADAGGGRSMQKSAGGRFDPVDIELGPDGAIWISSWGREYGAKMEGRVQQNEGRIYRIWPTAAPPSKWSVERNAFDDLGHHLPVWRSNAQRALINDPSAAEKLKAFMRDGDHPARQTWSTWAFARQNFEDAQIDLTLLRGAEEPGDLNRRIQSIRALAFRGRITDKPRIWLAGLTDPHPRIRHETILAVHQLNYQPAVAALLERAAVEADRVVFYSLWQALRALMPEEALKQALADSSDGVRRAALLALLEDDRVGDETLQHLLRDKDQNVAALAAKRLGGKAAFEKRGRPIKKLEPTPVVRGVHPFGSVASSSKLSYRTATLVPGVRLYTDRAYQATKVPDALLGKMFLQTACGDADYHEGVSVDVDINYPSTVYLLDDARAEQLPAWARDDWQLTDLVVEASDPPRFRVYKREVAAGKLTLGTNRDSVQARKGNYLLVADPILFTPHKKPSTAEQVLALLPQASPQRGRDLFFSPSGPLCYTCHRLEGVGNLFAPDLAAIGDRTDAEFLVRSLIDPSADITEGFPLHILHTRSGDTHAGMIVSETQQEVTLGIMGGASMVVPSEEITARESKQVSPMPSFAAMLPPQRLADLTAFLQSLGAPAAAPVGEGFAFREEDDEQLHLYLDGVHIASYLLEDPVLTRRAFVNVKSPSGIPVTRPWPAPESEDHASMHPGLWMSFGWLSGNDYWRLQSKVRFAGYIKRPKGGRDTATFSTLDEYLSEDGSEVVCTQHSWYRIHRHEHGYGIVFDASFVNTVRGFEFGDQEESGLAVRMARPLTVEFGNGRILNNHGDLNGKGTWGKPFSWIDYAGEIDGTPVGVFIVPHGANPRPSWSHSRDYGALVANPFPRQPKERRVPYVTTPVKAGERFRLHYSVLIHEGNAFDPQKIIPVPRN